MLHTYCITQEVRKLRKTCLTVGTCALKHHMLKRGWIKTVP